MGISLKRKREDDQDVLKKRIFDSQFADKEDERDGERWAGVVVGGVSRVVRLEVAKGDTFVFQTDVTPESRLETLLLARDEFSVEWVKNSVHGKVC